VVPPINTSERKGGEKAVTVSRGPRAQREERPITRSLIYDARKKKGGKGGGAGQAVNRGKGMCYRSPPPLRGKEKLNQRA